MKNVFKNLWLACLLLCVLAPRAASAALVSQTDGVVSFSPADLVTPILTAIIGGIGAAVALWIVWTGVKWLFKIIGVKR